MECDGRTLFTSCTENIVWFLMTVSEFQVNLWNFIIVQLEFHLIVRYDVGFKFVTATLVRSDLFSTVEMDAEIPLSFCIKVSLSRLNFS